MSTKGIIALWASYSSTAGFFELVDQNKQVHRKILFSTQKSIDNYYWIIMSTTY
jgi:hypothetical protein